MIDYLRKASEAILLLLIVVSPWAFGATHPISRYVIVAGVSLVLLFWAIELLVAPSNIITKFQLPIIGLVLVVYLSVLPLGDFAGVLSPEGTRIKSQLLPSQVESLANGQVAEIPFWTARGRISFYPAETFRRAFWMVLMALLFTRVQNLASVDSLRRLCLACLINGSILSYFAVFQHFASDPGEIYWFYPSLGASFGPFINRNHFAFYTNICFGLSLGYIGSRMMGKVKSLRIEDLVEAIRDSMSLWMLSVLVFMIGAVILCSSRAGLISLVGGTLITAMFVGATGSFREGWKWFALAACIFAIAACIQIWLGFDFVDSRYAMHNDNRTALWQPLLQLIPQFPLFGTGLGSLPYAEPLTRISTEQRDVYLEYAHNEYLQVAIEAGVIGLLCGIALLVLLSARIAARIRSSRHNAWLYVGCLFALATVSLHSFAEFGPRIPAIALLAVTTFGHIAGLGSTKRRKPSKEAKRFSIHEVTSRAFAVGMVVFLFFAVRDAKLFDLAERHLLQAQRAQRDRRPMKVELEHYQLATNLTPNDVELQLEKCRIQFHTKQKYLLEDPEYLRYAQSGLIRVRELCPMAAEPHAFIAQHIATFGSADTADDYFARALMARPNDEEYWYITGKSHLDRNEFKTACEHFSRSLALSSTNLRQIMDLAVQNFDADLIKASLVVDGQSKPLTDAANWLSRRAQKPGPDDVLDEIELSEIADTFRRRALETDELKTPNSAALYVRKAVLHRSLNELDEAIAAYQRALAYDQHQVKWRLAAAELLGEQQRYDEAHRHLERIINKDPNHTAALRLRDKLFNQKAMDR